MIGKVRFIDDLRPATPTERTGGGYAILPSSPGGLASIAVFKILRERFGKPNDSGDPAKTFWAWALTGRNGVLTIYDWKGGWAIGFDGEGAPTPELEQDASKLLDDLLALGRSVRPGKNAAVGGVITNPYRIFSDIAESLLEQVADLKRDAEMQLEAYRKGNGSKRKADRPKRK